ncbi:MAG: TonB family protein [Pseudomonadota bacterium]|jgi:TonB family protein
MLSRRALLAGLGGGALLVARASGAAAERPAKVYLFNLPAQLLKGALVAYSAIVGAQIIYDSRLVAGRQGREVIGLFTADTALRMLIEGTDLLIRHTSVHDIALVPASQHGGLGGRLEVDGPTGALSLDTLYLELPPYAEARPEFTRYTALARDQVRRALSRSSETAFRTGTLQVELRVDPAGRLREVEVSRPSGSNYFDQAVRRALRMVSIGEPPPRSMPQPIRLTIVGF